MKEIEMMDFRYSLPAKIELDFSAAVTDWEKGKIDRLWARDASLWTNQDESKWMGWLDIVERQQKDLETFRALSQDIQTAGFQHALLLGMGGSSLCPEVLAETFGQQQGFPRLSVVDSTDPAQVRAAEQSVDLKKTVILVSSKSGSTLEPNLLKQYFMARMKDAVGNEAGKHFIAVTDPGSQMEQVARADGFRHILWRSTDRRPLLRALQFRYGSRRHDGPRCGQVVFEGEGRDRRLPFNRRQEKSWRRAGVDSRPRRQCRARQNHLLHLAPHLRHGSVV